MGAIRIRDLDHVVLRVADLERRGPSMYVTDPEGNVVELKGPPE